MNHWIVQLVTVPVGEMICYWVMLIALGMIASIGWSAYFRLKKRKSLGVFTCPFAHISKSRTVVNNPSDNIQNQDNAR